ncbi:hypothetical protein ACB094_11G022200 [Castanea mollissima]
MLILTPILLVLQPVESASSNLIITQKTCGFLFTSYTFVMRWCGYLRMRTLQERNSFQLHSGATVLWPTSKVNLGSFLLFTIYNKTSLLTPHSFKCWGNINKITSMSSVN